MKSEVYMTEELIMFTCSPTEFLKKIRVMMEDVVEAKMNQATPIPEELSEKTLLRPSEVCTILRISRPTLYTFIKQGRLKSFKISAYRYFARTDIEEIIRRQNQFGRNSKAAGC